MASGNRQRRIGLVLLIALIAIGSGSLSATAFQDPPEQDPEQGEGRLYEHMEAVNTAFRAIRKTITDPARRAQTLDEVHKLQTHIVAAKPIKPHTIQQVAEAKRAAFFDGYRRALAQVLREVTELELEVFDGKYEKAAERLRTIHNLKNEAHEKYQG